MIALTHVVAYFLACIPSVEKPAIAAVEPQFRQVVFVEHHAKTIRRLDEIDVRLDQAILRCGVSLSGAWVERPDQLHPLLNLVQRPSGLVCNGFEFLVLEFGYEILDDRGRHAVFSLTFAKLNQQALLEITRRYAERIEGLYQLHSLLHVFSGYAGRFPNLFQTRRQIAIFVEIAQHGVRRLQHGLRSLRHAELPLQVVDQRQGFSQEGFQTKAVLLFLPPAPLVRSRDSHRRTSPNRSR